MPSTRRLCLCLALVSLVVGCGQGPSDPAGRLPEPASAVTDEDPGRTRPVVSADRAALPPVADVAAVPETTAATRGPAAPARSSPPEGMEGTGGTAGTGQRPGPPALTPPGTVLDLGTAGVAVHDRRTEGALVTVTPQVVRQGRAVDLSEFDLDAHLGLLRPVYVEVSYANAGELVIATPTLGLRLDARSAAGRQATRLNVVGAFPSCEGAGGLEVRPGDTVTDCVVFLLPDGDPLRSVSWQGMPDRGGLTWTVTPP